MDGHTLSATSWSWVAESEERVRHLAVLWLGTAELRSLVLATEDAESPSGPKGDDLLLWSHLHLETRRGRERRESAEVLFPPKVRPRLLEAAGALGLLATRGHSSNGYDAVVILGGATTGNALRAELAAGVTAEVATGKIIGLTSERPLTADEHRSDPDSVDDRYEWQDLLRQIQQWIGPLEPASSAEDHCYMSSHGHTVRLLITPTPDGFQRPTTQHQVNHLCKRIPIEERRSVLLITNAIYAPYQFFSASPILLQCGTGRIELIGSDTSIAQGGSRLYQRLAQEIHSGIVAATSAARPSM